MALYFITGNEHKMSEVMEILAPQIKIYQMDIELAEVQSIDPQEVIRHKLIEAAKYQQGEMIVEDTSLTLEALNWKLPGPLIKFFVKALTTKGIFELAEKYKLFGAEAKTCIGYSNGREILFFEGTVKGKLVKPKGVSGFGWDPIFVPEGQNPKGQAKTFAEMGQKQKNEISHRKKAVEKFKEYYLKKPASPASK